jgi:hypothetical protein
MKRLTTLFLFTALAVTSNAMAGALFTDGLSGLPSSIVSATDPNNTVGNFTVFAGTVVVLEATDPSGACASTCLFLDGGVVTSKTFTLAPGDNYLTFTLNTYPDPNAAGSTMVNLADTFGNLLFSQTYTDPAPGAVKADIFVSTATTVNLFVGGQSEDVLSNVSVTTPEPSTALLSLPFLAFGALAYRRRAKVTA